MALVPAPPQTSPATRWPYLKLYLLAAWPGVAHHAAPHPAPASLLCPPFRPSLRIAVGLSIAHALTSCRPVAGVLRSWFGPGFCSMTHPSLGPEEVRELRPNR